MKKTINIKFEITSEFVESILTTAFNGGINYWCEAVECEDMNGFEYKADAIANGSSAKVSVYEEEDYQQDINELNFDNICEGFERYVEWSIKNNMNFYTDPCDLDTVECDKIVQMAIFKDIIFG